MTVLSVNLNKVALLRNQRDIDYPSVIQMAEIALKAGAQGITVHPRPDERHTRKTDVSELATLLRNNYPAPVEFNIEGYPTADFLDLVEAAQPQQVTLVPDDPDQKTSDHGWNINKDRELLTGVIARIRDKTSARVSVFVDHVPAIAAEAASVGADRIELYTGPYFEAFGTDSRQACLDGFRKTAEAARDAGLEVNAGHDLNLENLGLFLETIPWVEEVSIGHALTADALLMGMDGAVRAYVDLISKSK
ncbi:pyridoxine 5'-phosphate synthase [Kiloniella sp. b19]|uniref:pyridoxine 5'-phosphate synthase n=1 Tax=Kiloniella sp. GXU_MW_B19 TaxID=3141326 RepID=UPI0031D1F9CA